MAGANPVHVGQCCGCTPSLRGAVQGAEVAIRVVRDEMEQIETRAAVTEAHNVTLQAALTRTQHEARRWRAAAEAAIGHRNAIEEELAAAKQELRALHAGKAAVA